MRSPQTSQITGQSSGAATDDQSDQPDAAPPQPNRCEQETMYLVYPNGSVTTVATRPARA